MPCTAADTGDRAVYTLSHDLTQTRSPVLEYSILLSVFVCFAQSVPSV